MARVFEEPVGTLDPATGQPWKKYAGACVVSVKDGVADVKAVMAVPEGAFWPFRRALRRVLGVVRMIGERWKGGEKKAAGGDV